MTQAGLGEVGPGEFGAAVGLLGVVGGLIGFVLFGGWVAALVGGLLAACVPVSWYRSRRHRRLAAASEAWPRLLEELRLLTGAAGRSIPQALFEVGRRAPVEWRPAFAAAEREWLLTTDFGGTLALLKERLADPTADVVCETLLVAHEVGGSGLDRRLEELIEDRRARRPGSQGRSQPPGRRALRSPLRVAGAAGHDSGGFVHRLRAPRLSNRGGSAGGGRGSAGRGRLLGVVRAAHARPRPAASLSMNGIARGHWSS